MQLLTSLQAQKLQAEAHSYAVYGIIHAFLLAPYHATNAILDENQPLSIEIDGILLLRLHLRNSINVVLVADLRMSTS